MENSNGYPYLAKNLNTGTIHVVEEREVMGAEMELTACGIKMNEERYNQSKYTILDAFQEKIICRRCASSDTIINFVIQELTTS